MFGGKNKMKEQKASPKTLNQIRKEKKKQICKIFTRRSIHADLSDRDQDKCLIEWLQQNVKKIFYKNLMPDLSGETQKAIEKSFKELLEELK